MCAVMLQQHTTHKHTPKKNARQYNQCAFVAVAPGRTKERTHAILPRDNFTFLVAYTIYNILCVCVCQLSTVPGEAPRFFCFCISLSNTRVEIINRLPHNLCSGVCGCVCVFGRGRDTDDGWIVCSPALLTMVMLLSLSRAGRMSKPAPAPAFRYDTLCQLPFHPFLCVNVGWPI